MKKIFSVITLLSVVQLAYSQDFEMTIMHINDHHSHLEPEYLDIKMDGKDTRVEYGSISRIATEIKKERMTNKNLLVLHAGDALTGTLYYTLFKGKADAEVMNEIGFDAFTIGNHEFDNGDETLSVFLKQLKVPVISANIAVKPKTALSGLWTPYIIKEINGQKVAIIGLATGKKTKETSSPSKNVSFFDEVKTTEKHVKEIEKKGINKIILLSHYGYDNSLKMASKIKGVDVIISGDQHALLGEEFKEIGLKPVGSYPTKVSSAKGEPVYVAEGWQYSFFLGKMDIKFDDKGIIKEVNAQPEIILGDSLLRKNSEGKRTQLVGAEREEATQFINDRKYLKIVDKDSKVEEILKTYSDKKLELSLEKIGESSDDILGGSENRIPNAKNPAGSYSAVAVAEAFYDTLAANVATKVDFVIENAGNTRNTLPKGDITIDSVYTLLPFGNTIYSLKMKGSEVKSALEDGIDFSLSGSSGSFPYGFKLRYEAKKEGKIGERVTKVEVYNDNTKAWEKLDESKMYKVGMNAYIASGKDGYKTLGEVSKLRGGVDSYITETDSFIAYVKKHKVLNKSATTNVKFEF